MPTCFFILSRFTLRVDNVLFRTYDTRIYHSFSSNPHSLIRETGGWEAPYDRVRRVRKFQIYYMLARWVVNPLGYCGLVTSQTQRSHTPHGSYMDSQDLDRLSGFGFSRGRRENWLERAGHSPGNFCLKGPFHMIRY